MANNAHILIHQHKYFRSIQEPDKGDKKELSPNNVVVDTETNVSDNHLAFPLTKLYVFSGGTN